MDYNEVSTWKIHSLCILRIHALDESLPGHFNEIFDKAYPRFGGKKMWGHYGVLGAPQLVIRDMELMKDVFIKDFDYFPEQREMYFSNNKYVKNMLIVIKGEKWKAMRTMTTPMFTSGKLRGMASLIDKVWM